MFVCFVFLFSVERYFSMKLSDALDALDVAVAAFAAADIKMKIAVSASTAGGKRIPPKRAPAAKF